MEAKFKWNDIGWMNILSKNHTYHIETLNPPWSCSLKLPDLLSRLVLRLPQATLPSGPTPWKLCPSTGRFCNKPECRLPCPEQLQLCLRLPTGFRSMGQSSYYYAWSGHCIWPSRQACHRRPRPELEYWDDWLRSWWAGLYWWKFKSNTCHLEWISQFPAWF